jgi:CBS domain-containing protein
MLAREVASLISMNVRDFMTAEPVTCGARDTIGDAAALMDEHSVGTVVVLRDGKLDGILTDRQVALTVGAQGVDREEPVEQAMTENPARVRMDADVFSVLNSMRGAHLANRMPVVNSDDELVGLVSVDDIAVIADNLNRELFHHYAHQSLEETHVPTGAKRMVKKIRNPKKADEQDPPELEKPVTTPHTEREHQTKST